MGPKRFKSQPLRPGPLDDPALWEGIYSIHDVTTKAWRTWEYRGHAGSPVAANAFATLEPVNLVFRGERWEWVRREQTPLRTWWVGGFLELPQLPGRVWILGRRMMIVKDPPAPPKVKAQPARPKYQYVPRFSGGRGKGLRVIRKREGLS